MIDREHPWKMPCSFRGCIQERQIPHDIWELSRDDFRSAINGRLTILLMAKGLLLRSETLTAGWKRSGIAQRGSSWGTPELGSSKAREAAGMAEGDCTPQPAKEAQAGEEVFKDFFLLIVRETEGKRAQGGMGSFSVSGWLVTRWQALKCRLGTWYC